MASRLSQRHRVAPLISATRPWVTTSCWSSARDHRASGTPRVAGSSQARAFTATTTPGGKPGGPPAAGGLLQPPQAVLAEPLPPFADDLAGGVHARRDGIIG